MKNQILTLIRKWRHMTFSELQAQVPGFSGDVAFVHAQDPNVILWPWCSDEALDALGELLKQGLIFMHPSSVDNYAATFHDYPSMPIVVRPQSGGYKSPRWLPVVFRDQPLEAPVHK
jgi:hypothetical protein